MIPSSFPFRGWKSNVRPFDATFLRQVTGRHSKLSYTGWDLMARSLIRAAWEGSSGGGSEWHCAIRTRWLAKVICANATFFNSMRETSARYVIQRSAESSRPSWPAVWRRTDLTTALISIRNRERAGGLSRGLCGSRWPTWWTTLLATSIMMQTCWRRFADSRVSEFRGRGSESAWVWRHAGADLRPFDPYQQL